MHLKMTIARLTAALLVSSTLAAPVLAASGTVNSGDAPLRVRADPNTSSQILTKLSDGTQVEVLEQAENGWYKIAHEGVTGFVSGEYLVVHEEGQEQAVPLASEADGEAAATFGRITASSLNVRSGPSTDHEKVGSLAAGRVVELLEESDGWYRVENGYISAEYVTIVDPSQISKGQEIADYALQFVGYPYVYGGSSPKGFDCSGFTSYVYKQFGITINRTASTQLDNGTPVSMSELQPGDLVMFKKSGSGSKRASHVGIYIGNDQFVHASTSTVGVIVSDMDYAYYTTGFVGGRRLV